MIAIASDIIILHKKNHRYAAVGEYLPIRIKEHAARVFIEAHFAPKKRVLCHLWYLYAVGTAIATAFSTTLTSLVPLHSSYVP